jgi:hypothetical protein
METKEAKNYLKAYVYCCFANRKNQLCKKCPWSRTEKCKNELFSEERVLEAIDVLNRKT